jgi:hypothetical protein
LKHYCTLFDTGYLVQGHALFRSLQRHEPDATLWVLSLTHSCTQLLSQLGLPNLRIITLQDLEPWMPALLQAKHNRSLIEYYFTLSPCLPLWLLSTHPEMATLTYLDADMLLLHALDDAHNEFAASGAEVAITPHQFPEAYREHYEKHGRFNVGFQIYSNTEGGRRILQDWAKQCLEWCHDRLEANRYADQKYLDAWPSRYGAQVCVLKHPGVNLAPWNWQSRHVTRTQNGSWLADGHAILIFHYARFKPIYWPWYWQSGNMDYGVMPHAMRQSIYLPYITELKASLDILKTLAPDISIHSAKLRLNRGMLRDFLLRMLFGSDWLYTGGRLWSLRLGLGCWSGHVLAWLRHRLNR